MRVLGTGARMMGTSDRLRGTVRVVAKGRCKRFTTGEQRRVEPEGEPGEDQHPVSGTRLPDCRPCAGTTDRVSRK